MLKFSLLRFRDSGLVSGLKVGDLAPRIVLKTDEARDFDLQLREGNWTVLYFYPRAETPGCTKQACAFRDGIEQIRILGAELYGISADDVKALQKFKAKHKLNFTLLADPHLDAISKYGTKMPVLRMSKRWTFIVDGGLRIRAIEKDVDPVLDARRVAEKIKELQKQS